MTPDQRREIESYLRVIEDGWVENGVPVAVRALLAAHDADLARLRALEEEVARLRALLHTGTWLRLDDGRTQLAVDMPPGADLSCRAYRDIAIDAALHAQDTEVGR